MNKPLATIAERYQAGRNDLLRRQANLQATTSLVATEGLRLKEYTDSVADISSSIVVVQNFSNNMRTDIITRFEELLTSGVREIFNKDYKITIEFSTSGNSYHADFYVMLPDGKKINLATGEGGGLRDFVSVLQRILYIMLEPTQPERIIFLDEALKALDADRSLSAFKFIAGLCKELDVQLVSITHSQAAKAMVDSGMASVLEVCNDGIQSSIKIS